jgi:hypothetical protein
VSNLSDLLPAGGGQNNTEFTASGAIAAGKPVILNSNGTVTQIAESTSSDVIPAGSQASYSSGNHSDDLFHIAWDSADTNKFMFIRYDGNNSRRGTAQVGTVSNSGGSTSISLGTALSFLTSGCYPLALAADPNNAGKFLAIYADEVDYPDYPIKALVLKIDGTSVTKGTAQDLGDWAGGSGTVYPTGDMLCADPNVENQFLFVNNRRDSPKRAYVQVITLASGSGTTVSYTTPVEIAATNGSSSVQNSNIAADPNNSGKFVATYRDGNNSDYIYSQCISLSGTTASTGTSVVVNSYADYNGTAIDFNKDVAGEFLLLMSTRPSGTYAQRTTYGRVGQLTGTSIAYANALVAAATPTEESVDPHVKSVGSNKFMCSYRALGGGGVKHQVATISSGAVTFATRVQPFSNAADTENTDMAADPNNLGRVVQVYAKASGGPPDYNYLFCSEVGVTTSNLTATNLLGVASAAISNSASGTINTWGSLVSDLPRDPASSSAGTPVVYESANADHTRAVFDSNSNKVVIAYRDGGNSEHGTAVVGTVSGTSISYGTPVVFEAAEAAHFGIAFDSNSNKVVISFRDAGNSNYGTAIVGTVDGTSISFGSPVVFSSANSYYMGATFDSSNNKVVIVYSTGTMKAIVGTVSSTSISFGTAVQFDSGSTQKAAAATFDSNAGKVVIAWQDSGDGSKGHAIVGTVSSTAISFGNEVTFEAGDTYYPAATFDSNSNKVVIAYGDGGNSYYGTAIVGTVSGTAISFGTAVVFDESWDDWFSAAFDSNTNKAVIAYKDGGNSNYGTVIEGTVSGTAISFDTAVVFETSSTKETATVFDSSSNKVVIAYEDAGNSSYGTGVVFSPKGPLLTPASDYYAQDDGTITKSTGGQLIGKAISTTQINIKDYTG